jgi:Family of unknown function (DUF6353)
MRVSGLIQKAGYLLNENSGTILTGVGVVGTVATSYLTGRASFKAAQLIEEEITEREDHDSVANPALTKFGKVKIVWTLYIPPVAIGLTTVTSIILANRLNSKKIAALVVASGVSERALQEYKSKVLEKLGDKHEQKIRDEIAQDRVTKYPPDAKEVLVAGTGEVLCMDMLTGRYFQSSMEKIRKAENKINYQLIHELDASLSEFYDELGLSPTVYTDQVGWNSLEKIEVQVSATLTPDNRPCLAIDLKPTPRQEYYKRYEET